MLATLIVKTGVEVETDVALVKHIIVGGHYGALGWEMPGVFHGHADQQSCIHCIVDVLDMWSCMKAAFETMGAADQAHLAKEATPFGEHVQFPSFDGHNGGEYLSIMRFLINDLDRFNRFRDGHHDLNSHSLTLNNDARMLRVFEPMRKTLISQH
ncbi:YfbU family protein [Xylella taiwanensis]|nr:YfbU family protein [Xylella taiwanensis]MCD8463439.1 YfbU family protein [Xylella taiwanensis]